MTEHMTLFNLEEKEKSLGYIKLGLADRFDLTADQIEFMIPKTTRQEWLERHWLTSMIDMLESFGISQGIARTLILGGESRFLTQQMLVSYRGILRTLREHKVLQKRVAVTDEIIEQLQKSKYLRQILRDSLDDGDY